jgi:hypothetical protein
MSDGRSDGTERRPARSTTSRRTLKKTKSVLWRFPRHRSIEKDRGLDLRKESRFIHVSRAQTQPFFNFFSTFIYITIRDKGIDAFGRRTAIVMPRAPKSVPAEFLRRRRRPSPYSPSQSVWEILVRWEDPLLEDLSWEPEWRLRRDLKKEFHPLLDAMPKDNPNPDDKVNIVQTRRTNPNFFGFLTPNDDSGAQKNPFLDPPADARVRDVVTFLEKKQEAIRSLFGKAWDAFLAESLGIADVTDTSEKPVGVTAQEGELPRLYYCPYSILLLSPMPLPGGKIGHAIPVVLRASDSLPCFLCWRLEDIERRKEESMFLMDVQFTVPLLQFSLFYDKSTGRFSWDPIVGLDIRVCSKTSPFHDASVRKWVEAIQMIHGP